MIKYIQFGSISLYLYDILLLLLYFLHIIRFDSSILNIVVSLSSLESNNVCIMISTSIVTIYYIVFIFIDYTFDINKGI